MPKCTIDGREIEVAPGTNALKAALDNGIHIQHFCWHPDLPVDGNCRTCMIEVEKMPKLQIACNTVISEGMVIRTSSEKATEAQRTALEFLLRNHPIDCPVCDQAGECYLQDNYMKYGLYEAKVEIEEKVNKRKVVDLGPIVLDAERCVLCSRCLRFESHVTGTNLLEFQNRGGHTQIASFENRPITHGYAGNLADVCPVGALLSRDFRFKMRVWFLEETESVCPGCSTGCNLYVDHRDGEAQRFRARRNAEVNKSWLCDIGRGLYRELSSSRLGSARLKNGEWTKMALDPAVGAVSERLRDAGTATAFVASPQASNEDLFAFRKLAEAAGGKLDFRVGNPQDRLRVREDEVLRRADHNPNTQGCLDLGLGRDGVAALLDACRKGAVKALVLQGPELLKLPEAADAIAKVEFVTVMATHEGPELEQADAVLPAAAFAEYEGTFTNYQRRVQRFRRAFAAQGDAQPRFEIAGALLRGLGKPLPAANARDFFRLLAAEAPGYAGLDYKKIGSQGVALAAEPEPAGARA
ncbi:MAG: 2Fe-2S iron-sulfur cluster-binding protein [Vicinamibacteria bacterium]